ncbi:phosphoenolpyruvate synthase [Paenibacillus sp. 1P07SE]|uniref:phosphoenolpyruvate synthase n=1 Tax=Paenibacillus sp. 1P07SE TaxID=3132209 RepID=UPI0039A77B3C
MRTLVLDLREMDSAELVLVGGKGLNLGRLSTMEGIRVPEGFCVTTAGFQQAVGQNRRYHALLDQLAGLQAGAREQIAEISSKVRQVIAEAPVPTGVVDAVSRYLTRLGTNEAYAIRSSATAEDLPHASFAGQQDTFLNIVGLEAILHHVSKCWASLFTDRAVSYRIQHGIDHNQVQLAVIVQKMVFPQASGIIFTADPMTSNRKLLTIDASFGLGEALVSGLVSADNYQVRDGEIVSTRIAAKKLAVYGRKEGGTKTRSIEPDEQTERALTEQQILRLAHIGRQIEAHFGFPQDIEWCMAEDRFYIVQSRPITTLYPIPESDDQDNRVYVSVGHQQMMTDPFKPLGLSFFLMTTTAPMRTAGGRLFVDVTSHLATPAGRQFLIHGLGKSDPLIKDALLTITERKGFVRMLTEADNTPSAGSSGHGKPAPPELHPSMVAELIRSSEASIRDLRAAIQSRSGADVFDFIVADIPRLRELLFDPQSSAMIMSAMEASTWINDQMYEWLGEKNAADTLAQSVPGNITSEMGLALMEVADQVRDYPEVMNGLQGAKDNTFLDALLAVEGGVEARGVIEGYLAKYGMRCAGEIDLTATRWSESPYQLVPMILGHIRNFQPGASVRKFEHGLEEALRKEKDLLQRLKRLPDGEDKADQTKRRIDILRTYSGYREYPKYGMINRYYLYKQALLEEAEQLVQAGVITVKEDVYYLTFEEFHEAVRTRKLDLQIIRRRKADYMHDIKLTPPRVMTSDGEIITGRYNREDLPAGALAGLPVSSGVIEGRARVLSRMDEAELEEGDILVTAFTDPGWTPLFVSIKGLITEVGGLMTHGAVIAREYGLPAVVGVEHATRLIRDGQRIRVHGTEGYVEIL